MDLLSALPIWALVILVFTLRVTDVTIGTLRTVAIVRGFIGPAMVLGFFEVGIWVLVIAQVIARVHESWFLVIAYAGGFAAGNGVGILLERKLAMGTAVVRMISPRGGEIATAIRKDGLRATTFAGEGLSGPVTLVYAVCPRRGIKKLLAAARAVDPRLFYVMDPAHETSTGLANRLRPVLSPTGWRAVAKKK